MWFGSVQSQSITCDGVYTIYLTPTTTEQIFIYTIGTTTGSIDKFSVREVGQDWTLGTGWSIGEDKASSDGSQTSNSSLFQPNVLTQNKYYKFEFTLSNVTSGAVRLRNGIGDSETYISYQNSNGTYTAYSIVNSSNKTLVVDADSSFNGSITNISVKEVGQNWALVNATIGNDLVLLNADSANAQITQSNLGSTNSTAKLITFTTLSSSDEVSQILRISQNIAGSGVNIYTDDNGVNLSAIGVHKVTIPKDTSANDILFVRLNSGANRVVSLSNFSVIEITTDTSLPRINYEGFSYQDALGSEQIVNGDFSNGSANWVLSTGWSVVDSKLYSDNTQTSFNSARQLNVTEIGKTYKLKFDLNLVSGAVQIKGSGLYGNYNSSNNGEVTLLFTADSTQFRFTNFPNNTLGTIDNVSVKEYLGQEVVPDSGCGSWLWEPQSTNLITIFEDYTQ